MLEAIIWIIVFIVAIIILVKSSDYFTSASEKIGLALKMPAFIVGITLVAIGTSLPELISSIIAVTSGASEIVVGNVIGSNIANILLVFAIAIIVSRKLKLTSALEKIDLPFFLGSALILAMMVWDGVYTWPEAVISLAIAVVYLVYTVRTNKEDVQAKKELKKEFVKIPKIDWKVIATFIVSAALIYLGAKYTVDSVINISQIFNIGTEIVAVVAVALGTSLPELAVTWSAARKGNVELAVGNVLGSNIFNALIVMGIPALIGTLIIPASILSFGLPMMLISTALFFFLVKNKTIFRAEGVMLIIFYLFFVLKSFGVF